jgi:hypothetical protein
MQVLTSSPAFAILNPGAEKQDRMKQANNNDPGCPVTVPAMKRVSGKDLVLAIALLGILIVLGAREAGYVYLSGARAQSLDSGPGSWSVQGRSARLDADRIEFDEAPVWQRADGTGKYRRVWVDLHSGQVRGHGSGPEHSERVQEL